MKIKYRVLLITLLLIFLSNVVSAQENIQKDWPKRSETWAPVRPITRGPAYHWFGYYDKLEFDPTGRYVLGMEVDFEHRSPTTDDVSRYGGPRGQRPLD